MKFLNEKDGITEMVSQPNEGLKHVIGHNVPSCAMMFLIEKYGIIEMVSQSNEGHNKWRV